MEVKGMLIKFEAGIKLESKVANTLEDWIRIQNPLERLNDWAHTNKKKRKRGKCKVLHAGTKPQKQKYRLRESWFGSNMCEKI